MLRASDNPKNPIYDKGLVAEVGGTAAETDMFATVVSCWLQLHCIVCHLMLMSDMQQLENGSSCQNSSASMFACHSKCKANCSSALLCHKLECVMNIQVSQFLFGDGFAVSGGDQWRVRRKAVNPALHKAYLNTMIDRVFAPSALHLAEKLQVITAPCSRES